MWYEFEYVECLYKCVDPKGWNRHKDFNLKFFLDGLAQPNQYPTKKRECLSSSKSKLWG